jgi:hypothetical protein
MFYLKDIRSALHGKGDDHGHLLNRDEVGDGIGREWALEHGRGVSSLEDDNRGERNLKVCIV